MLHFRIVPIEPPRRVRDFALEFHCQFQAMKFWGFLVSLKSAQFSLDYYLILHQFYLMPTLYLKAIKRNRLFSYISLYGTSTATRLLQKEWTHPPYRSQFLELNGYFFGFLDTNESFVSYSVYSNQGCP